MGILPSNLSKHKRQITLLPTWNNGVLFLQTAKGDVMIDCVLLRPLLRAALGYVYAHFTFPFSLSLSLLRLLRPLSRVFRRSPSIFSLFSTTLHQFQSLCFLLQFQSLNLNLCSFALSLSLALHHQL